ncbi:extracellular solute-binding protein [Acidicapsa acidisoli]|uniref:extracellular solute-binding protein n=1 Tax=Acidicapsa acidisoli TaxID=1615681 RepID=UPI0021DFD920|nr:extracellular solute-binding protein [Acidicapsa acidisoli]
MKTVCVLGILLLLSGSGCSRQSPREPVTVTFLDIEWDTPDKMPGLARDLQEFTRETGIRIKRIPRPDGSFNQLALWRQLLQQGSGAPDVVSIDVIWSGILNQYLMDLKPYFATELASQNPVVAASYTVGDKVVAIPHHAYVGVLLYRPDLLRKYGYRDPPKTWDELEQMSTRIQAGERAKGQKDFWGYVWQGGIDEDLTCSGLEWQISEGGGRIIEDDKTISVNNPQVVRAWQRAAHWVGSISPPGVVAYGKWDAQNVWGSGKAAFLRGWQSDYSLISHGWPFSGSRSDTAAGDPSRFGITSMPGGRVGRVSALGGNGLAVSQSSAHPREAIELIRFLLDHDRKLMLSNEHSEPSAEAELFELPVVLNPYPELTKLSPQGGNVVARPSVVAGEKYGDVSKAYLQAVHSVLTREKAPSIAAADLEKELVAMTGFRTGPPKRD